MRVGGSTENSNTGFAHRNGVALPKVSKIQKIVAQEDLIGNHSTYRHRSRFQPSSKQFSFLIVRPTPG